MITMPSFLSILHSNHSSFVKSDPGQMVKVVRKLLFCLHSGEWSQLKTWSCSVNAAYYGHCIEGRDQALVVTEQDRSKN